MSGDYEPRLCCGQGCVETVKHGENYCKECWDRIVYHIVMAQANRKRRDRFRRDMYRRRRLL
jgi:hypothetical protein